LGTFGVISANSSDDIREVMKLHRPEPGYTA